VAVSLGMQGIHFISAQQLKEELSMIGNNQGSFFLDIQFIFQYI
jgi:hypothetical protein